MPRQVIDGLLYDTDAEGTERLGSVLTGAPYWQGRTLTADAASVYRTASGRLFAVDNAGRFRALDEAAARSLLGRNPELYARAFGAPAPA